MMALVVVAIGRLVRRLKIGWLMREVLSFNMIIV